MKMELRAELQKEGTINVFKKYEAEYKEFQKELLMADASSIRENIERIFYIEQLYSWIMYDDTLDESKTLELTGGKSLNELADIMINKCDNWEQFEKVLLRKEEKTWN